jgi:hypothetical protein
MVDLKGLREGMSIGGDYTVEEWIGDDGTGTFFAARSQRGQRLLIKAVPAEDPGAEPLFAAWRRLRDLHDPHLLELRDVGRDEVGGNHFIYGVFENPDEILPSLLEKGPLSEVEARTVLAAAVEALRCLHDRGLVHGAVTADHIVGVGESVKLATDVLRESDSAEAQGEDVRQLGQLLRSVRAPERLGEPLATIAVHAADGQWTLAEIAQALEAPPAVAVEEPAVRQEEAPVPSAPPAKPFPKRMIAGAAIALLALVAFSLLRRSDEAQPLPPAPAPAAPRDSAPVAPRVPTPHPAGAPAVAASTVQAAAPAKSSPPASAMWRVIAFTYHSRDMAAKKVKQINERWPDMQAMVFAPRSLRGYYLVALGDRMERDEAAKLLNRARRLGLPRDAFVQNYSE